MNDRRRAVERMMEQRESRPLKHGDHMLLTHALRCRCAICGRLVTWSDCDEQGLMRVECCKQEYVLKPWSVKVYVTDISDKPLMEPMAGSDYPNNDVQLRMEGGKESGPAT